MQYAIKCKYNALHDLCDGIMQNASECGMQANADIMHNLVHAIRMLKNVIRFLKNAFCANASGMRHPQHDVKCIAIDVNSTHSRMRMNVDKTNA